MLAPHFAISAPFLSFRVMHDPILRRPVPRRPDVAARLASGRFDRTPARLAQRRRTVGRGDGRRPGRTLRAPFIKLRRTVTDDRRTRGPPGTSRGHLSVSTSRPGRSNTRVPRSAAGPSRHSRTDRLPPGGIAIGTAAGGTGPSPCIPSGHVPTRQTTTDRPSPGADSDWRIAA